MNLLLARIRLMTAEEIRDAQTFWFAVVCAVGIAITLWLMYRGRGRKDE